MIVRSGASALALALAAPVAAQVTTQQAATGQDASSATRPQDAGEIVVTGEKRNRTLQDTPTSVAVVTKDTIVNENLYNVYDVLARTPNLSPVGNETSFSIRGIDAFNVSGGGDGVLASVYVDGAVLPQAALATGPLDLYDIAQVEVFRGPQSTVQGRNSLAGAIIIRTTDPGYTWSGTARAVMTDKDGQRRLGAAVGGPVVDDQIAFRLAGEIARSDGYVRNVTLDDDGDRRRLDTIRGKLLLTPTALPGLRVVATYLHDTHRRGTYWTELDPPYRVKDRIATEDTQDETRVRSDIATLEIGYDLAPGYSLSSITNYSDIRSVGVFDPDRSAIPGSVSTIVDPSKTVQQELRLNIDKSWVKGLVGGYFLRDDNRDYFFEARQRLQLRRLGIAEALEGGFGLSPETVDTVLDVYDGVVPIRNTSTLPRLTHNYAGFADLTFPITPRLRVIAGLRYDDERQTRSATQTVSIVSLPDPATAPAGLGPIVAGLNDVLDGIAAGAGTDEPTRRIRYHAWLPKAGITYDLARDVSLSFTAQRGYRAGGSGLNQFRGEAFEYNPEYVWDYELALRSEFLDHRLTVNANAFYLDWRDQQVSVELTPGSPFDSITVNAGHSRVYGGELSIDGRPTRTLDLFAGAGYANTRFTKFDVDNGALLLGAANGTEFTNAPHWTLSGAATWHHPSGILANVNVRYRSGFFEDQLVQVRHEVKPLALVDAKVGWQGRNLGIFVVASNLFDTAKPTQVFADNDGRNRGVVSAPRTVGLDFEGRF